MIEITRNDIIDVGEVDGPQSSTPAVAAGFAADAGSEGGGRRAGGRGVANDDEREGEGGRGGKDDDESQEECGGGMRRLAAGCVRFRGRLT